MYSKLKDLLTEEKRRVNLYAAVLDSSAPYYLQSISKYLCTMKLIDDTVNSMQAFGDRPPFLSATFFSRNKDEIPQIFQVGTIIRIHRGDTKSFSKSYQLNCDSGIKGAWAIFDPVGTYTSMSHTGKNYTFIDEDNKRLKKIREFAYKFFTHEDVTETSSIGMNIEEVDLIEMVLKRKEVGKVYDQLTVFDGVEFRKIQVPKTKYRNIGVRDVVRIRGLTEDRKTLVVNDYTNIMKIENKFETAVQLLKKIEEAKKNKLISEKLRYYIPIESESCVISEVLDKSLEVISLKDLYMNDTAALKNHKYRIKVNAIEIGPRNSDEWAVTVDTKARSKYKLPESTKLYYKFQIFAKDFTNESDHNIYPIYLCNIEGKGNEFMPSRVKNDHKELKKIHKLMIKPWFHLDVIVEPVVSAENVMLFIVDTKLTI